MAKTVMVAWEVQISKMVKYKEEKVLAFNKNDFLSIYYPSSIKFKGNTFNSIIEAVKHEKAYFKDEFDWQITKFNLLEELNIAKFNQNQNLKKKLLSTANYMLVADLGKDLVLGSGISEKSKAISDIKFWKGQNLLGKSLMKTREKIRNREAK